MNVSALRRTGNKQMARAHKYDMFVFVASDKYLTLLQTVAAICYVYKKYT